METIPGTKNMVLELLVKMAGSLSIAISHEGAISYFGGLRRCQARGTLLSRMQFQEIITYVHIFTYFISSLFTLKDE